MKDFYSENYRILLKKKSKKMQITGKTSYPWIGRLNIVKISIYPKWATDSMHFFFLTKREKKILKCLYNLKGLPK